MLSERRLGGIIAGLMGCVPSVTNPTLKIALIVYSILSIVECKREIAEKNSRTAYRYLNVTRIGVSN